MWLCMRFSHRDGAAGAWEASSPESSVVQDALRRDQDSGKERHININNFVR